MVHQEAPVRKRFVTSSTTTAIVLAVAILLLAPLLATAQTAKTKDMFVAADTDSYDKGLPIGSTFPSLKALYRGEVVTDLRPFIHDKGMVFIANRSADW